MHYLCIWNSQIDKEQQIFPVQAANKEKKNTLSVHAEVQKHTLKIT